MSDDQSKISKLAERHCELTDEDPTDQSPIPDFAKRDQEQKKITSGSAEKTIAKLTPVQNNTGKEASRADTLRESNEMLIKQKEEILELRDAIASMHSEIERLQEALTSQPAPPASPLTSADIEPAVTRAPSAVNRLLVVISGGQRIKYPLFKESMTIGRSPENDIQIATQFVSRVHARIISDQHAATIEDLNSRNGVVVNSRKITRQQLRNGDLIALGKVQFKFIDLMEDDSGEGRA